MKLTLGLGTETHPATPPCYSNWQHYLLCDSTIGSRCIRKKEEVFYLTTHSTHFIYGYMASDTWLRTILIVREETRRRHMGNSFNDALNTFYLRLYGVRHMVKDHSDSERGNPLPPHRLLFPISTKGSFICIIPHTYHGLCYTSRGTLAGTRNMVQDTCILNPNMLKNIPGEGLHTLRERTTICFWRNVHATLLQLFSLLIRVY